MTCAEFAALAVETARGASPSEEALRHASGCESCAAVLAEQRELSLGLKRLGAEFRDEHPPALLEQNLLRAFRESCPSNSNQAVSRRSIDQAPGYLLRAAAAILVVAGVGAWLLVSAGAPESGRIAVRERGGAPPPGAPIRATEEFIPVLGYGPVGTADSGIVVRVLLPEDAFQYFAIPLARPVGGGRFPADVLVADDGSVRAIRLLNAADGRR